MRNKQQRKLRRVGKHGKKKIMSVASWEQSKESKKNKIRQCTRGSDQLSPKLLMGQVSGRLRIEFYLETQRPL